MKALNDWTKGGGTSQRSLLSDFDVLLCVLRVSVVNRF
jgi:hypothetical protein